MNRYPLWKNATVLIALVLGFLYTLPNFFGEVPAVQVASVKATHKVDTKLMAQVESALKAASITPQGVSLDLNSVRVRFADTDTQLKARDAIEKAARACLGWRGNAPARGRQARADLTRVKSARTDGSRSPYRPG